MSSAATELQERVFEAEWDEEGVYFYQAFNDAIADWALEHQRLTHFVLNMSPLHCCVQVWRP